MADDIASLGLAVDSKQVVAADQALNKFAASAKSADQAAGAFKTSTAGATSATAVLVQNLAAAQRNAAAVNQPVQQLTRNAALSGHALSNLAFQMNDVATMAALGADPLRVLASQAGQFYQILAQGEGGVRGSISFLRDSFIGLLTPLRVLTGGVVAFGAAAVTAASSWASAQNEVRLALMGVGSAAGVTVADINRISFAAAEAGRATVGEAREMALAFASTGRVSAEIAQQAVSVGRNLAKVFGEDTAEAAQRLARALADPAKGVDDLDKRLAAFDDRTAHHIKNLSEQGRFLEAQRLLLDGVSRSTAGASEATTGLARSWTQVMQEASRYWVGFGNWISGVAGFGTVEDQIVRIREQIKAMENQGLLRPFFSTMIADANKELERLIALQKRLSDQNALAELNRDARELGGMIERLGGETAELQRRINEAARLRDLASNSDVVGRLSTENRRALEDAIAIADARIFGFKTSLDLAIEQHRLDMDGLNARTAAQKGELAFRQTLLRLGQPLVASEHVPQDPRAVEQATLAKIAAIAEHEKQIAESQRSQLLYAQQRVQSSTLELGLVGQSAAVQERARAALEVRQQVEAEALRLYGDRNAFDQKHLDALMQEALKNADINRLLKERQLMLDISFERGQMGRTSREQSVYARLQSAGMLTNGEIRGAAAEAAAAQLRLNNILQTNIDMSREFTSSLVRDLLAGRDASEALSNALSRLADRFADLALDHAFQALFGGKSGGNSWLASLLGMNTTVPAFHRGGIVGANDNAMTRTVHPAVFAGAKRYHNGGFAGLRSDEVPAILQRGERVLARGESFGGGVTVQVVNHIDASGADPAAIGRLETALADRDRALPSIIVRTVQQARDRRVA